MSPMSTYEPVCAYTGLATSLPESNDPLQGEGICDVDMPAGRSGTRPYPSRFAVMQKARATAEAVGVHSPVSPMFMGCAALPKTV